MSHTYFKSKRTYENVPKLVLFGQYICQYIHRYMYEYMDADNTHMVQTSTYT